MNKNEELAINFNQISKIFSNESGIRDISFGVKKGSFHALIGANGAGKTTLIRSLLRLYKKYSGVISINNTINKDKKSFKGVSYISELPIFPGEFTAFQYLMWAGKMAGLNEQEVKLKIERLAAKFHIDIVLNKKPTKFSSGQKQKLMLMKVIIEDADIIIMDEPTANLDPSARIVFFDEIKKIHDKGKTIFLCSHNLDEIEKKVSWVTVLKEGRVTYNAAKDKKELIEIFKTYGHDSYENKSKVVG